MAPAHEAAGQHVVYTTVKMKFFACFYSNLRQLRIVLSIELNDTDEKFSLEVTESKIIVHSSVQTSINLLPFLTFDPLGLSNLSIKSSDLAAELQATLSVVDDVIPPPAILNTHPPSLELMNDWVYCHNHSHGDGKSDQSHQGEPILTSHQDVVSYLSTKGIGDEVLLESSDKTSNLFLRVICPALTIFHCDLKSDEREASVSPKDVILIEFKLLNAKIITEFEEIKQHRSSFNTEWSKIEAGSFNKIFEEIVESCRNYLPKASIFTDSNYIRSMIIRS